MTKLKIDYSEARDWYIKGNKDEEGIKYPSLPDIAREFEYSLSTLRKKAANEGWFKKREERMALKDIISMRKDFMGKAIKLSKVSLNSKMLSVSISENMSSKMRTLGFLSNALAKESLILRSAFQMPCNSSICVSGETLSFCICSAAFAISHAHKIRSLFAFGRILWKLSRKDPGKKWLVLSTRAMFERRC